MININSLTIYQKDLFNKAVKIELDRLSKEFHFNYDKMGETEFEQKLQPAVDEDLKLQAERDDLTDKLADLLGVDEEDLSDFVICYANDQKYNDIVADPSAY